MSKEYKRKNPNMAYLWFIATPILLIGVIISVVFKLHYYSNDALRTALSVSVKDALNVKKIILNIISCFYFPFLASLIAKNVIEKHNNDSYNGKTNKTVNLILFIVSLFPVSYWGLCIVSRGELMGTLSLFNLSIGLFWRLLVGIIVTIILHRVRAGKGASSLMLKRDFFSILGILIAGLLLNIAIHHTPFLIFLIIVGIIGLIIFIIGIKTKDGTIKPSSYTFTRSPEEKRRKMEKYIEHLKEKKIAAEKDYFEYQKLLATKPDDGWNHSSWKYAQKEAKKKMDKCDEFIRMTKEEIEKLDKKDEELHDEVY